MVACTRTLDQTESPQLSKVEATAAYALNGLSSLSNGLTFCRAKCSLQLSRDFGITCPLYVSFLIAKHFYAERIVRRAYHHQPLTLLGPLDVGVATALSSEKG